MPERQLRRLRERRGSDVPAVRGHREDHLRLIPIDTVDDLIATFRRELPTRYDAIIHAMAVLDFTPADVREEKVASSLSEWTVRLVPTPKAAALVRELAPRTFFVGFKLEVGKQREELIETALEWGRHNQADLVVANDLRDIEGGTHIGYLVGADGQVEAIAEGKEAIARALVDLLTRRLGDGSVRG